MQLDPGALRAALAQAQVSAWFQPQVDIRTREIVGYEALCRWHHPDLGFVPPIDFITRAEETGEIAEIGRFMAEESMRAATAWARPGTPLSVSVNVSPLQLETTAFTDWLAGEVRQRGLSGAITVEITESRPLADVPSVVRRLDDLRAAGVGIALDDFGTGQASLTQLKRLHATELKIDRSLMQDDSDPTTAVIAHAVGVGHDLGMVVVAEGIETPEQFGRAGELGCDRAQGYLIGRPMPGDEVAAALVG